LYRFFRALFVVVAATGGQEGGTFRSRSITKPPPWMFGTATPSIPAGIRTSCGSDELTHRSSCRASMAPYDLWMDGKFGHCGVDTFDLIKTVEDGRSPALPSPWRRSAIRARSGRSSS